MTTEDWRLMDCQEYFMDLEMSLAGVATALEVSAPGQLRDDQVGVYRELELEVGVARGLANKLRARHLEAYNLQEGPVAFADSSGIGKRLMMARMRLDEKLAANLPPDQRGRHGTDAPAEDEPGGRHGKTQRPTAKSARAGGQFRRGVAMVLRSHRRPIVVPASVGDSCPTLSPRSGARGTLRRDEKVLRASRDRPND